MIDKIKKVFFVILILIFFIGCNQQHDRVFGFVKLGKVSDIKEGKTFLKHSSLVVFRKGNKFRVMEAKCTYDLSPLRVVKVDDRLTLRSQKTTSVYDEYGNILSGPTKKKLPFFKIFIQREETHVDLYAVVGETVPRTREQIVED